MCAGLKLLMGSWRAPFPMQKNYTHVCALVISWTIRVSRFTFCRSHSRRPIPMTAARAGSSAPLNKWGCQWIKGWWNELPYDVFRADHTVEPWICEVTPDISRSCKLEWTQCETAISSDPASVWYFHWFYNRRFEEWSIVSSKYRHACSNPHSFTTNTSQPSEHSCYLTAMQ